MALGTTSFYDRNSNTHRNEVLECPLLFDNCVGMWGISVIPPKIAMPLPKECLLFIIIFIAIITGVKIDT